jgi:hypothetical protein
MRGGSSGRPTPSASATSEGGHQGSTELARGGSGSRSRPRSGPRYKNKMPQSKLGASHGASLLILVFGGYLK